MSLDEKKTQNFIYNFLGYGSSEAKIAFIGYEEACSDENDPETQIENYSKLHIKREICCISKIHNGTIGGRSFLSSDNKKPQNTWRNLIKIYKKYNDSFEGTNKDCTLLDIQKICWGKSYIGANDFVPHCLIELFPLPNKGKSQWLSIYKDIYKDRKVYEKSIKGFREKKIKKFIDNSKIDLVINYSGELQQEGEKEIIHLHKITTYKSKVFNEKGDKFFFRITKKKRSNNNTYYWVDINHPSRKGITDSYFDIVTEEIIDRIKSQ